MTRANLGDQFEKFVAGYVSWNCRHKSGQVTSIIIFVRIVNLRSSSCSSNSIHKSFLKKVIFSSHGVLRLHIGRPWPQSHISHFSHCTSFLLMCSLCKMGFHKIRYVRKCTKLVRSGLWPHHMQEMGSVLMNIQTLEILQLKHTLLYSMQIVQIV